MPVAATGISLAARGLRILLGNIDGLDTERVLIDRPKNSIDNLDDTRQHVNLFFYRVQHSGYPADGLPDTPVLVRLHCLITALGAGETDGDGVTITAGEYDLRLIGQVIRILHEQPTLILESDVEGPVAQLQIIPEHLSLDDINRLWSTQGEVAYRLSVAYEMALVPLPVRAIRETSQRVGAVGTRVNSGVRFSPPAAGEVGAFGPRVPLTRIDPAAEDWAPHICFIGPGDNLEYALLRETAASTDDLSILLAGNPADQVVLRWEIWTEEGGWTLSGDSASVVPSTSVLDPEAFDAAAAFPLASPLSGPGQALLYAERTLQRIDGSTRMVASNRILLTVYGEIAP